MLIRNRYEFDENNPLGKGGFGKTFLAKDRDRFGELCVVKRLDYARNDSNFAYAQEMFEREAKVLHNLGEALEQIPALKHRIPKLHAYFTEASLFYLVQQWIPGETLAEQIKTAVLSERQVRSFLLGILPVLRMIHDHSIVHRDIKPSNIIIRASDGKPVLIDFGIVKELAKASPGVELNEAYSTQVSTFGFSPPEQQFGQVIRAYTDIYSLGVTAIYALTGELPHSKESKWHQLSVNVSHDLKQILDKAIQTDPLKRYGSAQEMLVAIQKLPALPGPLPDPIPPTRIDPVYPVRKAAAKSSSLIFSIAGILAIVAAVVAGYFYSNYRIAEANRHYQTVQADLKKIEDLKKQGNHQACIAEAQRFTQSHAISYLNPTAEAEQLGNECAAAAVKNIEIAKAKGDYSTCITEAQRLTESQSTSYSDSVAEAKQLGNECTAVMDLQSYLRVDIPKFLQERNQSATAKIISTIQPSVKIEDREITVIYDGSTNSDFVTNSGLKHFAAFFMSALRGQSIEFPTTKYADFSILIVSPEGRSVAATITTEQWDTYLEEFDRATSTAERENIKQRFVEKIQVSAR